MTASSDPFLPSAVAYSARMESRWRLVSFSCVAFGLERGAQGCEFRGEVKRLLRNGFEFESELAALAAEGFGLRGGCGVFGAQTLHFAIDARQTFFGLRELVA